MQKRILTMFWLDDTGDVHLYKDVGGIPYALAKYCGWQATFAYSDHNGIITNNEYEKYVKLDRITCPKFINNLKKRQFKYFWVAKYAYLNALKYDVINFYHAGRFINLLCWLVKKRNPNIKTYVKLDMGKASLKNELEKEKSHGDVKLWRYTDLFTVETNKYVASLNKLSKFNGKVKHLPNGFFSDLADVDLTKFEKEKIILTVGRLGTYEKNTELLIETLLQIEDKLDDWQIYLVGSITERFKIWLNNKLLNHSKLKSKIIITGNITNKRELYQIYAKSSIFILTSRYESWGLALTEAMHFANYPIVTQCCDAFDEIIISDGFSYGKIINNSSQFKEAIIDVLDDKIDYLTMGKEAKKIVDRKFNWKNVIETLNNYLS